jgi:hypothetical protein
MVPRADPERSPYAAMLGHNLATTVAGRRRTSADVDGRQMRLSRENATSADVGGRSRTLADALIIRRSLVQVQPAPPLYPSGIPINRLSSRNTPTTKAPMSPRSIEVLSLSGRCFHRSKSRSHHLSSPSPRRSSTLPPGRIRSLLAYRRGCSTTSVLDEGPKHAAGLWS